MRLLYASLQPIHGADDIIPRPECPAALATPFAFAPPAHANVPAWSKPPKLPPFRHSGYHRALAHSRAPLDAGTGTGNPELPRLP